MKIKGAISDADRRHTPRVKLDQLAYINLRTGNGGIVLDVSNEGLGLQAVAPIVPQAPIRFWFATGSIDGMEASGELVWKDETGKRGGLRFTHLPDEVDKQIRVWLGQPKLPPRAARDSPPARAAQIKSAPASRNYPAAPEANHVVPGPAGSWNVSRAPASEPWPFFRESKSSATDGAVLPRHRLALMVPTVVVALGLGVAIGILSYAPKRETGEFLIHLGERLSGGFRPQSGAPAPAPASGSRPEAAPPSSSPGADAAPRASSELGVTRAASDADKPPAKSAGGEAAQRDGASARAESRRSQAEGNGQAELALARKYLRDASGPGNTAEAAQLLWSAVEKGNVAAEVDLADLFLRGVGMPKNCEQARVLLTAAYNRNNALAGQKLSELSRYGCK
jgi:hypothetical protein